MMTLLQAQAASQEVLQVVDKFTPERHVYLAYAIVTVMLWGYIALVLIRQSRLRRRLETRND